MKFSTIFFVNIGQSKESRLACFLIFPERFQEFQYMYFHLLLHILSIVLPGEVYLADEKKAVLEIEK